jgi:hypothetical protein
MYILYTYRMPVSKTNNGHVSISNTDTNKTPILKQLILSENYPPVYGGLIRIPANTLVWRGYDTRYPAVSNRPAYYGNYNTAYWYAHGRPSARLGAFTSRRDLNLIDYRFMQVLLMHLFEGKEDENYIIAGTTISFGLCSYGHQLKLLDALYGKIPGWAEDIARIRSMYNPSLVSEQRGIRIGETTHDSTVMGFLREIFDGIADGYIAPSMYSPYHDEKNDWMTSPEIIIFNPEKSTIYELPSTTHITGDLPFMDILKYNYPHPINLQIGSMDAIACIKLHGGRHRKDTKSRREEMSARCEAGARIGRIWREKYGIPAYNIGEIPSPTHRSSIWTQNSYTGGKIWGITK